MPPAEGASCAPRRSTGAATRIPRAQRTATLLQPELPFARASMQPVDESARAAFEARLRVAVSGEVALRFTDNRRTMLSFRRRGAVRDVRLHHMFLDAPPQIVEALGRYLARGDRFASRLIDRYIAANQGRIRPAPSTPPTRLHPQGRHHDLAEIQRELSGRYFEGVVKLDITWGRQSTTQRQRRARRTIRMGTYFIDEKLIRIHPALDQAFVPRYFVAWVVYHEMLHHVVPMPVVNGRKVYHSAEFRARERLFHDYDLARAWEEQFLPQLIASRRTAAAS
jgi:hypothetical protein